MREEQAMWICLVGGGGGKGTSSGSEMGGSPGCWNGKGARMAGAE